MKFKCKKLKTNITEKITWCGEESCEKCSFKGYKILVINSDLTECDECGATKKTFMHNCPDNSTMIETFGCPKCDDECGFCK